MPYNFTKYILLILPLATFAQSKNKLIYSGSVQIETQVYRQDKILNPYGLLQKTGLNAYLNNTFSYHKFTLGLRFEAYQPALLGFPDKLKGTGLAHRYLSWKPGKWQLTAGHFYEQFGNGAIFRTQEQRLLGMDNALDGLRIKWRSKNLDFMVISGKQRLGFEHAAGLLSGAQFGLRLFNRTEYPQKKSWKIHSAIINKNEPYLGILKQVTPNVWAFDQGVSFSNETISADINWAHKSMDASQSNGFVIHPGNAIFINTAFNFSALSASFNLKRVDNMDFRSERGETLNQALINYIPNTTKQYAYRLLTLYPYVSQVNGEMGGQSDVYYTFKDGTSLSLNLAAMNNINKTYTKDKLDYSSRSFQFGDKVFYRNLNLELEKYNSNQAKTVLAIDFLRFNKEVIIGGPQEIVDAFTFIWDQQIVLSTKNTLRFETQHLWSKQDKGNWFMLLTEWTNLKGYGAFISDELNYHTFNNGTPLHYYQFGGSYSKNSIRLNIGYGRVREGLFCVGGICRIIPAHQGLNLSVFTSFP